MNDLKLLRIEGYEQIDPRPSSKNPRFRGLPFRPKPCIHCGIPATRKGIFEDSDGARLIEKYCDSCIMNPAKFREIQRVYNYIKGK